MPWASDTSLHEEGLSVGEVLSQALILRLRATQSLGKNLCICLHDFTQCPGDDAGGPQTSKVSGWLLSSQNQATLRYKESPFPGAPASHHSCTRLHFSPALASTRKISASNGPCSGAASRSFYQRSNRRPFWRLEKRQERLSRSLRHPQSPPESIVACSTPPPWLERVPAGSNNRGTSSGRSMAFDAKT